MDTWREIANREDPDGHNHDLRLICVKCNNAQTCRCSKPKREFKGICDECSKKAGGKMKIKISKRQWEQIGKIAQWEFDHRDPKNYAPGETPYTDEQYAKHRKLITDALKGDPGEMSEEQVLKEQSLDGKDDDVSRRRIVKVTFSDGDHLTTWINGTVPEIKRYYMPYGNRGPDQDYDGAHPDRVRHVVSVEFLK